MPLHAVFEEYVGRKLFVLPYYGYGWNRQDSGASPPTLIDALGPEPFHVRVEDCFFSTGQFVGAGGAISEQRHPFDRHWCVFCLREVGDFNFTDRAGHYMIWITPSKPTVEPSPEKAIYQWVLFDKSLFCLSGYGMVAESVDYIRETYDKTRASRKLAAERQDLC